jgi:hypothetical protein
MHVYIVNIQELLRLLSSALRGVGEGSERYRIINFRFVGVYFSSWITCQTYWERLTFLIKLLLPYELLTRLLFVHVVNVRCF